MSLRITLTCSFYCRDTLIKYMTDGVLLRETLTEPDLDR